MRSVVFTLGPGIGITDSTDVSIIFAGLAAWGGGDGLQLDAFRANVE